MDLDKLTRKVVDGLNRAVDHDGRIEVERMERFEAVEEAVGNHYITPIVKLFLDDEESIAESMKRAGMEDFSENLIAMVKGSTR